MVKVDVYILTKVANCSIHYGFKNSLCIQAAYAINNLGAVAPDGGIQHSRHVGKLVVAWPNSRSTGAFLKKAGYKNIKACIGISNN